MTKICFLLQNVLNHIMVGGTIKSHIRAITRGARSGDGVTTPILGFELHKGDKLQNFHFRVNSSFKTAKTGADDGEEDGE